MMKLEELPALEISGKTVADWNLEWQRVVGGFGTPQPQLNHKVGLFRAVRNGEVMALGSGTGAKGGLSKRIADFRRKSLSASDHTLGRSIRAMINEVELEVLITGWGNEERETALSLKPPMIELHQPAWNVPNAPFQRKI